MGVAAGRLASRARGPIPRVPAVQARRAPTRARSYPRSDCSYTCATGACCTSTCTESDCAQVCTSATCSMQCTQGDCTQTCTVGSCRMAWRGGGCSQNLHRRHLRARLVAGGTAPSPRQSTTSCATSRAAPGRLHRELQRLAGLLIAISRIIVASNAACRAAGQDARRTRDRSVRSDSFQPLAGRALSGCSSLRAR